jgi:nucleotide-binding universal stress UspA family protein
MLPIKKILCPTDFSEPSIAGVRTAAELAGEFDAEILLVHVVSPIPTPVFSTAPGPTSFDVPIYQKALEEQAKNELENMRKKEIPENIKVKTYIAHGNPGRRIIKLVEEEHVDLVVISGHGEGGIQRLIFGSVAEKVVREACCPVLSIRIQQTCENDG